MSAQTRYRTLVHNISRVYSSPDAGRTELLQAGIDEIVGVMSPNTTPQWRTVKADTERLLRVWSAKEGNNEVSCVVADQIVGLLEELSIAPPVVDRIAHVNPYPSLVVNDDWSAPVPIASSMAMNEDWPAPVLLPQVPMVHIVSVTKEEEDTESVASIPVEDESDEEEEEESEVASVPESVKGVEKEPESEVEEEEEEEVVEPDSEEEAEEEEVGMEVEQVMIRGRTYWKDTNTNKLYAVIRGEDGEDDVGDEVGVLENGKPRFLAK